MTEAGVGCPVVLEVGYSWTLLYGGDAFLLKVLDTEMRYPTPVAQARESGIDLLDEEGEPIAWDGYMRLLRIRKTLPPKFPTGLLDLVLRLCRKFGYFVETRDKRVRPEPGFPEPRPAKITLRDYQEKAATCAESTGHGLLVMPPRSGKTRTMFEIHRRIALPTVWIVPTDRIAVQTLETAEAWFGKNYAVHLVGTKDQGEAAKLKLVICTVATAAVLNAEFYASRLMVVVDEWHHSAASTYREIVMNKCEHIFYRFGMTGTNFRSGEDELAMRALLSNVIYEVPSSELVKMGHLVPADVVFLPVTSSKLRVPGSDKTFQNGHGKHGIQEHDHRNQLVAHAAALLARQGRRTIVLVGTKAQGNSLRSLILPLLPAKAAGAEFHPCEFVSTNMKRVKINAILDSFNELTEVRVLIGTSLVGEGVDLPPADAMVYARGESAEVTLMQAAFRVCTAVPGKTRAVIVDFGDRHHKKLLAHSLERMRAYHDEPIFTVKVLDGTLAFVAYAKALAGANAGVAR